RVGGDEFMVVFVGADAAELSGRVASLDWKVREAGREMLGDETIGIDVGLACFPENGADADSLLAYVEQDLERSKRTRKSGEGNVLQLARSLK
ncbi:MAG TPA: diguanylate cyclase, partial [Bryobacteraceae bacterium]|nr:diguanylate cyclase [Bryobacteraceae bacterium]